jgi:hypothetical protein
VVEARLSKTDVSELTLLMRAMTKHYNKIKQPGKSKNLNDL